MTRFRTNNKSTLRRFRRNGRAGIAAVEAAICIPVLLLTILATVDCCSCIFLKQSLTVAAYEGGRVAIVPGSQMTNVEAQVQWILLERNIKNATITVAPSDLTTLQYGDHVTVTVSAKASDNGVVTGSLFSSTEPKGSVTFMVEQ